MSIDPGGAPAVAQPVADGAVAPAAPVVEQAPVVAAEPSPVAPADAAPIVETPVEPSDHTKTASLLEEAGKVEDPAKPAEEPKPGEEPPTEPQAEKPAMVYEPFKTPEGVTLLPEQVDNYTKVLSEHGISQEAGQALLDRHLAACTEYAAMVDKGVLERQHQAFADFRANEAKKIMGDPVLGGAGFNTTKVAVAEMRDHFVSDAPRGSDRYKAEMAEFNQFLSNTGAGDMLPLWRLLNNVARKFKEPAPAAVDYRPPADIGRPPKLSGRAMLYDKSGQ
ncbi:MAG TPA: hypothetical protein VGV37_06330 [Aliidongia sp.]|uniref:hypothetical protein n=1 Tax=Aliidongia sp. TaxID=1914230 RepID=UPI002DDCCB75|nr:hypothetical protein [Aliidongia sp.]HEV2674142.1 hypothetical protein [Aliidongia sp.]